MSSAPRSSSGSAWTLIRASLSGKRHDYTTGNVHRVIMGAEALLAVVSIQVFRRGKWKSRSV